VIRASDYADALADVLEERGWTQHAYEAEDGAVCLRGAVEYAWAKLGELPGNYECLGLDRCLAEHLVGGSPAFPTVEQAIWNDAPGRTVQQVLDRLRAIAKDERRREEAT